MHGIHTNRLYLKKEIRKKSKEGPLDGPHLTTVGIIDMLSQLQWATLEQRRYIIRLSIFRNKI